MLAGSAAELERLRGTKIVDSPSFQSWLCALHCGIPYLASFFLSLLRWANDGPVLRPHQLCSVACWIEESVPLSNYLFQFAGSVMECDFPHVV